MAIGPSHAVTRLIRRYAHDTTNSVAADVDDDGDDDDECGWLCASARAAFL